VVGTQRTEVMRTLFTCRLGLAVGARARLAPGEAVPPELPTARGGATASAAMTLTAHASATAKAAAHELKSLSARVMM
jgi:hypothetical protein